MVILHADPVRGGAERYTADVAAAVAARGHVVSLLAGDFGGAIDGVTPVLVVARGATRRCAVSRVPGRGGGASGRPGLRRCSRDAAGAGLRRLPPARGVGGRGGGAGHLKHPGRLRRAAARWATRLNPRRTAFAAVERRLLTSARPPVVLCLSDYVKATVRAHFALPEDRLATLFNAVDLSKFGPPPGPPSTPPADHALGGRGASGRTRPSPSSSRRTSPARACGRRSRRWRRSPTRRWCWWWSGGTSPTPTASSPAGRAWRARSSSRGRRPTRSRATGRRIFWCSHPPRPVQPGRAGSAGDGPAGRQHGLQRRVRGDGRRRTRVRAAGPRRRGRPRRRRPPPARPGRAVGHEPGVPGCRPRLSFDAHVDRLLSVYRTSIDARSPAGAIHVMDAGKTAEVGVVGQFEWVARAGSPVSSHQNTGEPPVLRQSGVQFQPNPLPKAEVSTLIPDRCGHASAGRACLPATSLLL